MKSKKKLSSISIKSFVTTQLNECELDKIAGGAHPDCPTDGGPETIELDTNCNEINTLPNRGCPIIM